MNHSELTCYVQQAAKYYSNVGVRTVELYIESKLQILKAILSVVLLGPQVFIVIFQLHSIHLFEKMLKCLLISAFTVRSNTLSCQCVVLALENGTTYFHAFVCHMQQ